MLDARRVEVKLNQSALSMRTSHLVHPFTVTVHGSALLLAAYVSIPLYKNSILSAIPIDITVLLSILCTLIATPTWMSLIFGKTPERHHQTLAFLIWLSLGLLVWLAVLYAHDVGLAAETAVSFTALVLLPILTTFSISMHPAALAQFLWVLYIIGAVMTAVALMSGVAIGNAGRLAIPGVNPVNLASATLFVPIIGFTFIWNRHPRFRILLLILALPAIVNSASAARGPLVAAVLTMVALLVIRSSKPLIPLIATGITFVVSMAVGGRVARFIFPESAVVRFESLGTSIRSMMLSDSGDELDTTVAARDELFRLAWSMFERAPILGNGTASFEAETNSIPWLRDYSYQHPHNLFLHFAAEYGLIGLVLLSLITTQALIIVKRRVHDPAWLAVGALYLFALFSAMFSAGLDNRLLWALTFLVLGNHSRSVKRERWAISHYQVEKTCSRAKNHV